MRFGGGRIGQLAVGVIGCGYWGPNLVRNFSENTRSRVAAVADRRSDRLEAIESRVPGAMLTDSYEELLGSEQIEAVAVTTPVSTHFEIARAALMAGKHVLVAKPLTASVPEADALIELAAENDRTLMVDHTFVYTGAVRQMRRMIEEGSLGELYYFDSVRVNLGLFQHDVNVIWDLAAHDFAILAYLFDVEPRSVAAIGACHSSYGMEDVAYVTIAYEDRLIAHCHVNWLSPVKIRQTLLGGSERMLVWDDVNVDEKLKVYDRGIEIPPEGEHDPRYYEIAVKYRIGDCWIPTLESHEALALEVDHFIDCIRSGETPITGGEVGRRVVGMLEASSLSLREHGQPIGLSEIPVSP
jgi:predicted dehydrogenase